MGGLDGHREGYTSYAAGHQRATRPPGALPPGRHLPSILAQSVWWRWHH
ncbi:hypothetical protein ACFXPA_45240 [Amycolatopsis sp. NPDC059090]